MFRGTLRLSAAALLATTLTGACAGSEDSSAESASFASTWAPHRPADPSSCPATPAAGKLTLYFIPPPVAFDWSTPNALVGSALSSQVAARRVLSAGEAKLAHDIGHAHLELECGDLSIPLTGQTGGDGAWRSALDGFGMLLRDFEGHMDAEPNHIGEVTEDLRLRHQSGRVTRVSFLVNRAMCGRIKSFHDAYVARGSYKHYSGIYRSRRFEGGGCGIFVANVIDVGGLLRRSMFTPPWVRSLLVGSARFSNVGGDDHYRFGSNLVAPGPSGASLVWPRDVEVPTSTWPIFPGSGRLSSWSGPEDQPFEGVTLTPGAESTLPFSIYDPELMTKWAEEVWASASRDGSAESLEARWTASAVGNAHEITTDARCTTPQTIPFESDNDDLFADSDMPAKSR